MKILTAVNPNESADVTVIPESTSKKMTIYDMAKMADVSTSTISRAISGHPSIKEETRQRILKIILRTGYRPNPAAQSLATKRAGK